MRACIVTGPLPFTGISKLGRSIPWSFLYERVSAFTCLGAVRWVGFDKVGVVRILVQRYKAVWTYFQGLRSCPGGLQCELLKKPLVRSRVEELCLLVTGLFIMLTLGS